MSPRVKKAVSILSLFLLLPGCVSIRTALYPNAHFAPVSPERVQILRRLPPDPNSYRIIGEVSADDMPSSDDYFLTRALKKKVGALGGDAVVLERNLESIQGSFTSGASNFSGAVSGFNQGPLGVSGSGYSPATIAPSTSQNTSFSLDPSYSGQGYILKYLPARTN